MDFKYGLEMFLNFNVGFFFRKVVKLLVYVVKKFYSI